MTPALVTLTLLAASPTPPATPAEFDPVTIPSDSRQHVLVLSAGASRGAYQAGVLYAMLSELRARRRDAAAAHAGSPGTARAPGVAGIAATSIGALNATFTALAWCLADSEHLTPDDNPLWRVWRDLSWETLFPGSATCNEYAKRFPYLDVGCTAGPSAYGVGDGVFTFAAIAPVRRQALSYFTSGRRFRPGCEIPIALAMMAEEPSELRLGKYPISSARRFVSALLRTRADGTPELCQLELPGFRDAPSETSLFLPLPWDPALPASARCRAIPPDVFIDAAIASASLPVALPPRRVAYCAQDCPLASGTGLACGGSRHVCASRFYDGGVFDALPLAPALELAPLFDGTTAGHGKSLLELAEERVTSRAPVRVSPDLRILMVDPSLERGVQDPVQARGSQYYLDVLRNFTAVAGQTELQTLQRYGVLKKSGAGDSTRVSSDQLDRVHRLGHGLVADLPAFTDKDLAIPALGGMSAFFDVRFRLHDYDVGIVDGIGWLARQACEARCGGDATCVSRCATFSQAWCSDLVRIAKDANAFQSADLRRALQATFVCKEGTFPAGQDDDLVPERTKQAAIWTAMDKVSPRETPAIAAAGSSAASGPPAERPTYGAFAEEVRGAYSRDGAAEYVTDHRSWRRRTTRELLERLAAIDRADGSAATAAALTFSAAIAAVYESKWRSGFTLGPAAIPARVRGSATLSRLEKLVIPSYTLGEWHNGGLEIGWEVLDWSGGDDTTRVHFRPVELTAHWFGERATTEGRWSFAPTMTLSADWPRNAMPEIGIHLRWWLGPADSVDDAPRARTLGATLFTRILASRIELGVGLLDLGCVSHNRCEEVVQATMGFADLNGLAYWVGRALTGGDDVYRSATEAVVGGVGP